MRVKTQKIWVESSFALKKSYIRAKIRYICHFFEAVITMTDNTDKTENTNPNWQVLPPPYKGRMLYNTLIGSFYEQFNIVIFLFLDASANITIVAMNAVDIDIECTNINLKDGNCMHHLFFRNASL